jgi:hypothetical protein
MTDRDVIVFRHGLSLKNLRKAKGGRERRRERERENLVRSHWKISY